MKTSFQRRGRGRVLWGGRRLIGSYWYLSMTEMHQTNMAGSTLKQTLFETLQPGLAVPLPSAHICTCRKAVLWLIYAKESLMTEKRSIQPMSWAKSSPNQVLSESCYRCLSQHPPRLPQLVTGLCYPLALLGLWAELSFIWQAARLWSSLSRETDSLRILSPPSLLVISPYSSPASSTFCSHTMLPIYLACIFCHLSKQLHPLLLL